MTLSILIKGAKMPQGCRQCHFKEWTNLRAGWFCPLRQKFLSSKVIIQDKRYDDCPLVEIPSHGELIDGTKLISDICEKLDEVKYEKGSPDGEELWKIICNILEAAPTVIESEGEK